MEDRFRNFTLWFSLLLCFCIGSSGATRVILCFTADGRAKMELQQDANCAGVAKGEAVGFSQEFLNYSILPPLLGDDCGPCTDIALPVAYAIQRVGAPRPDYVFQGSLPFAGVLAVGAISNSRKKSDVLRSLHELRPMASILSHLSSVILVV